MAVGLSVGLARAITSLSIEHEGATGVRGSLALWANVLQYVGDGIDVGRELPRASCLSKRALTTGTKRLVRMGLVEAVDKSVRLTDAGVAARDGWRPTGDDAAGLRSRLVPIVAALELEHPHFPTQYGTADCSMNGGPGQDWKPVPRVGGEDEARGLPIIALLSEVFVALAIAYDQRNGALAQAANVLAFVPDEGTEVSSLPADAPMVLGGMERHGRIVRSGTGPSALVSLTPLGRALRDRHESTLASVSAAIDPDGSVADEVEAFVASRPSEPPLAATFHPPTHVLFGRG